MPTKFDLPGGFNIGDNVGIRIGDEIKFYRITNRDNILYVDASYAAVTAGTTADYAEVTALNPPKNQLYQFYRVELILGNVKVYLKQPAATNRWGTNRSPAGGFLTDDFDSVDTNIFVIEDYPPNISIKNGTNVSITPKLRWTGWRYDIEPLTQVPAVYTPVSIGGLSK